MKGLLFSTAFAIVASLPAGAAELVTKAPAPASNWTGFYYGAHAGGAYGQFNCPCGPIMRPGGFVGVQVGYNYQFARRWVVGLEQDIALAYMRANRTQAFPQPEVTTRADAIGTIRARFGTIWNGALVYQTLGLALGHNRGALDYGSAAQAAANNASAVKFSQSQIHAGFAVGAGIEMPLMRDVSVKVEYLYLDFMPRRYFGGTSESDIASWSDHTLKVGVNWRLR